MITSPLGKPGFLGDGKAFDRNESVGATHHRHEEDHEERLQRVLAYATSNGRCAIAYRGVDDHIHEIAFEPTALNWGVLELTDRAGAPNAAASPHPYLRPDMRNAVLYRCADGDAYELDSDDSGRFR